MALRVEGASYDICNPVAENQSYLCIQNETNKSTKICLIITTISTNIAPAKTRTTSTTTNIATATNTSITTKGTSITTSTTNRPRKH